eukprot:976059_1
MFPCFNLFLLVSLIHSQTIDPKSTSEQICISDSVDDNVNGIYYYYSWDSDTNGSIYYNYQTNKYLYPWVDTSTQHYRVSSDPTRAIGTYCRLPITNKTVSNSSDCFNNYVAQWQSFNGTQWVHDKDLRLMNCNDICVSGNFKSSLDGTYKWTHFNRTTRSSVYQCSDCSGYVYYLLVLTVHPVYGIYMAGFIHMVLIGE